MPVRQTLNYHNVASVTVGRESVLYTSESTPRRIVVRELEIVDASGQHASITLIGEGHDIPVTVQCNLDGIHGEVPAAPALNAEAM